MITLGRIIHRREIITSALSVGKGCLRRNAGKHSCRPYGAARSMSPGKWVHIKRAFPAIPCRGRYRRFANGSDDEASQGKKGRPSRKIPQSREGSLDRTIETRHRRGLEPPRGWPSIRRSRRKQELRGRRCPRKRRSRENNVPRNPFPPGQALEEGRFLFPCR